MSEAAFTLLEILVALSILVLLVVMLSYVFGNVSKTWQMGQSSNERLQNVRAITDLVTNEVRSALLPVNRTDKANLQFIVNPANLNSATQTPDSVFWQAPIATTDGTTDVAEIGYFIRWDSSRADNPRPMLCRLFVNPDSPNYLVYKQTGSTPWLTDAVLENAAPADKASGYNGLVAENVVALFVQCLDVQGQPITRNWAGTGFTGTTKGFDSRQGFTDAKDGKTPQFTDPASPTGAKLPLCALPPTVKLSLVMMDARAAAKIGPSQRARLISLALDTANASPKGDAEDFVKRALADSSLRGIAENLRAASREITLQNAR